MTCEGIKSDVDNILSFKSQKNLLSDGKFAPYQKTAFKSQDKVSITV